MGKPSAVAHARASFDIPSLDGLRAVSFFLVFLGHAGFPYIPAGFGVTVFFFLSGYLITTLLRVETERNGRISFKLFYLRRALRIWPPFYLVLVVATLLAATHVIRGDLERDSLVAQALHYSNYWIAAHGWGGIALGTGVYWSLAVEEHFYLVFPALFSFLFRRGLTPKQQRTTFFAICGAVLAWRCLLVLGFHSVIDRTYLATDTRFDSLLFGCGLAVFGNPAFDRKDGERPSGAALGFLAAGFVALLVSFLYRDPIFRETFRYTLQGLGLYPIFITAIRFPSWGPNRFLNLRPVKFVGTLSYSLYLIHHVVVEAVLDRVRAPFVVCAVISLAISVALATLVWYFIEEPCAVVRRRLTATPNLKPTVAKSEVAAR